MDEDGESVNLADGNGIRARIETVTDSLAPAVFVLVWQNIYDNFAIVNPIPSNITVIDIDHASV